jgi:hypothetical protein
MSESTKNTTINFQIEGIELLEYAVNSPSIKLPENIQYRFDVSIEHKISIELKKVFVITSFKILNDDLKLNLGQAKISCIYTFPDVESFLNKENNKVDLPQNLIDVLNSISLSTSRGVMFTLFRGTFLHNVILPVVDPKTFTKNV